jgi:hypothetical protein
MTPQEASLIKPCGKIDSIFEALEVAGFPRSLHSLLLPEWVTPEVLSDENAASEVAVILAKRLGLQPSPLFAQNPRIELLKRREIKYKRSIPNKAKDLTAATAVAVGVAEAVASACRKEFVPLLGSAIDLRQEVLTSVPGKWLGLRNLLMTCWSHGLPVIHLADLRQGIAKMDGMVIYTGDRPVIVLSKISPLWSWQLFILAHEIAHLLLGHITRGEILVDEELGEHSYALRDNDSDEYSADMFAIELLNGRQSATHTAQNVQINSQELAKTAYEVGVAQQIDPGHIVLNLANQSGKWDLSVAAAKILQGNNQPAAEIINEAMWGGIDTDALPIDTIEFLDKLTGSSIE